MYLRELSSKLKISFLLVLTNVLESRLMLQDVSTVSGEYIYISIPELQGVLTVLSSAKFFSNSGIF